jgi:hypothetical protein
VRYRDQHGEHLVTVYNTTVNIAGGYEICGGKDQAGPSGCSDRLEFELSLVYGSIEAREAHRGLAPRCFGAERWQQPASFQIEPCSSEREMRIVATIYKPLERREAFKVTGFCKSSAPFDPLLGTVAAASTGQLTNVEIATSNALLSLASPVHPSFSRPRHFEADARETRDPADMPPFVEDLEVLDAYRRHLAM